MRLCLEARVQLAGDGHGAAQHDRSDPRTSLEDISLERTERELSELNGHTFSAPPTESLLGVLGNSGSLCEENTSQPALWEADGAVDIPVVASVRIAVIGVFLVRDWLHGSMVSS